MTKKIATMILAGVLATPAMAQQPPVTAQPASSTIRQIPPTTPVTHAPAPIPELDLGPTMILKMRDALKLTDVQDNAFPRLNWGGIVIGLLILLAAGWLLVRRLRRYRASQ